MMPWDREAMAPALPTVSPALRLVVTMPNPAPEPGPAYADRVRAIVEQGRDATIKALRAELKRRSGGVSWSVTGGRGTSWGWLTITAPPARRTAGSRQIPGTSGRDPEHWEQHDREHPDGGADMTMADRVLLAKVLGKDSPIHMQGESIPADNEYRREYLHRAMTGTPGPFGGTPYWD